MAAEAAGWRRWSYCELAEGGASTGGDGSASWRLGRVAGVPAELREWSATAEQAGSAVAQLELAREDDHAVATTRRTRGLN